MDFFSLWIRDLKTTEYFLQLYYEHLESKDHFQWFLIIQVLFDEWMKEGGEEGGKEERKGRKGRKGTQEGEEGGVDALDIEWKPWRRWQDLVRKAGQGANPVGGCPVSLRGSLYNLLIAGPQLCPSVSQFRASCVSLPLKRFSSRPRLNGLQLNAQMYSSSLSCWKGNILKNMTTQYHKLEKLEEGRKGYKGGIKQNF